MSLSSIVTGNKVSVFREELMYNLKQHSPELIVGAIMTVISISIVVAATGDLNQVFAMRHRH